MKRGALLALVLAALTVLFIAIGTLHPNASARFFAGGEGLLSSASTPEAAARKLGSEIELRAWQRAYNSLGNKAQFTEQEFFHDITGYHESLRTYATLESYEVFPQHATASDADVQLQLHWSTVVGSFTDTRNLHLVRNGDRWVVDWPLVRSKVVPPQVIAVNYLRWDVIYRGAGDDWGIQDVEAPHVRIVDMHPVQRAAGVVILGELLNEDIVPAYVSVRATLQKKDGTPIASEGSFDKISHILLPKQVTPFLISFPNQTLADVGSIRMEPISALVSASADPVIEIQNQQLHPIPDPALTGQLENQSGQIVNVAHIITSFYNQTGQVVWIADEYTNRALMPQTPVPFRIPIPEDLAHSISSERTVVATYRARGVE